MTTAWSEHAAAYFAATGRRRASPLVARAIRLATRGDALELGSGGGADARRLVSAGFHVTAVDLEPAAGRHLAGLAPDRLRFVCADLASLDLLAYDLISAQYTLPFVGRARLARVLPRLASALRPGGVLAMQLFGVRHGWNRRGSHLAFHTRAQLATALRGLDVVSLDEEDRPGPAAGTDAPVRWHVFHVLARRPPASPELAEVLRYRNPRVIDAFVARFRLPRADAARLFRELLKLLWMSHRGASITLYDFHRPLDELWHLFLLDTRAYERFCRRYFGRLIHHAPERPGARRRAGIAAVRARLTRDIERVQRHLGEATARLWYQTFPVRYPPGFLERRRPLRDRRRT